MPASYELESGRGGRRWLAWLFWAGVGLAPLAALLLLLRQGVGPARAAAVLAVLSVVMIGLSVTLREDATAVRDDFAEQLRREVDLVRADVDTLRRGVELTVHRELERVRGELEAARRDPVLRTAATRLSRFTGELPAPEEFNTAEPIQDDYRARPRREAIGASPARELEPVRVTAARVDAEAVRPETDRRAGREPAYGSTYGSAPDRRSDGPTRYADDDRYPARSDGDRHRSGRYDAEPERGRDGDDRYGSPAGAAVAVYSGTASVDRSMIDRGAAGSGWDAPRWDSGPDEPGRPTTDWDPPHWDRDSDRSSTSTPVSSLPERGRNLDVITGDVLSTSSAQAYPAGGDTYVVDDRSWADPSSTRGSRSDRGAAGRGSADRSVSGHTVADSGWFADPVRSASQGDFSGPPALPAGSGSRSAERGWDFSSDVSSGSSGSSDSWTVERLNSWRAERAEAWRSEPARTGTESRDPLGVDPLGSTPLGSTPLSAAPLSSGPLSSAPLSSGPLGSAPLSSGPLGSAPLSSGPLGSAPLSSDPLGSAPLSSWDDSAWSSSRGGADATPSGSGSDWSYAPTSYPSSASGLSSTDGGSYSGGSYADSSYSDTSYLDSPVPEFTLPSLDHLPPTEPVRPAAEAVRPTGEPTRGAAEPERHGGRHASRHAAEGEEPVGRRARRRDSGRDSSW